MRVFILNLSPFFIRFRFDKENDARIIITNIYEDTARRVFCYVRTFIVLFILFSFPSLCIAFYI